MKTIKDKDLGSKIKVYAFWLLQQSSDPIDEIEWLVNLVLDDSPNHYRKQEMLEVLQIHKNHEKTN